MKIKKGDSVVVIAGDEKSSTPRRVIQVLDNGRKVLIQGVNQVWKHVRRGHAKSPQGGRLHLEMPIQSSNVMFYCESCNKPSRLGLRYSADGAKERFCRKCSTTAGTVSPSKKAHAKS
ncbi:MAG: 50S ribosomal protein L24 [Planctomycetaceae bacterium]|nr:50S ribosomal protein L24 [Planctomycetaceae bacterium]